MGELVLNIDSIDAEGRVLLKGIHQRFSAPGTVCVMGSGGAGKSTLLRAIVGRRLRSDVRLHGSVSWSGGGARAGVRAAYLPQSFPADDMSVLHHLEAQSGSGRARALERLRRVQPQAEDASLDLPLKALPRDTRLRLELGLALDAEADLLLLDEPTVGVDEASRRWMLERVRRHAAQRLVVLATHNRQDALELDAEVVLLAGGTVQERARAAEFFEAPRTDAGRRYVATGGCALLSPAPPRATAELAGLWWIVSGLLGGMSRPGISRPETETFALLARRGVHCVLCLEESLAYAPALAREHGIALHHFPVRDMAPPRMDQTIDMVRIIERAVLAGEGVVAHCRGGLGRTGTVLACALVWLGDPPDSAVARVRAAQPLAIQTPAQLRFVAEFAERTAGWNPPASIPLLKEKDDVA